MNRAKDERVLFMRKEAGCNNDDDLWDDSELIKAYDKAIPMAKLQILQKIQKEIMSDGGNIQDTHTLNDAASSKKKKKKKNKNKLYWSVGDACRAIYSEDGKEYEAEIIAMTGKYCCRIRYIGYDNEEEALLRELRPSLGGSIVELQKEMAKQEAILEEMENKEDDDDWDQEMYEQNPHEATKQPSASTSKRVPFPHHRTPRRPAMFDPSEPLPPLPPMPPFASTSMKGEMENDYDWDQEMYKQNPHEATHKPSALTSKRVPFPHHRTPRRPAMFDPSEPLPPLPPMPPFASTSMKGSPTDTDAFNAMVMSWYLCGFYTACYERDCMDQKYS